jgi:hypothetical protein
MPRIIRGVPENGKDGDSATETERSLPFVIVKATSPRIEEIIEEPEPKASPTKEVRSRFTLFIQSEPSADEDDSSSVQNANSWILELVGLSSQLRESPIADGGILNRSRLCPLQAQTTLELCSKLASPSVNALSALWWYDRFRLNWTNASKS